MALGYQKALDALRSGDTIMVTHPNPNLVEDRRRFRLVTGGGSLTSATFAKLEEHLEPVGDGLFPDCGSQTYRLRGDA